MALFDDASVFDPFIGTGFGLPSYNARPNIVGMTENYLTPFGSQSSFSNTETGAQQYNFGNLGTSATGSQVGFNFPSYNFGGSNNTPFPTTPIPQSQPATNNPVFLNSKPWTGPDVTQPEPTMPALPTTPATKPGVDPSTGYGIGMVGKNVYNPTTRLWETQWSIAPSTNPSQTNDRSYQTEVPQSPAGTDLAGAIDYWKKQGRTPSYNDFLGNYMYAMDMGTTNRLSDNYKQLKEYLDSAPN